METSQRLEVTIVSLTPRVARGEEATLRVRTAPTAQVSAEIRYSDGIEVLGSRVAGADGFGEWTWRIPPGAAPGVAQAVVSASVIGRTLEATASFTVVG